MHVPDSTRRPTTLSPHIVTPISPTNTSRRNSTDQDDDAEYHPPEEQEEDRLLYAAVAAAKPHDPAAATRLTTTQTQQPLFSESAMVNNSNKLIERLVLELDRKSEAIQRLGQDCLTLRKHASTQNAQILHLRDLVHEQDLSTRRLIKSFDVDIVPPEELKRRYVLLAQKLETALEKLGDANEKVAVMDQVLADKDRSDLENKALRQAHTAQQTLVLDLQESLQKAQKFKSVIQKQEDVIRKLEMEVAVAANGVFTSKSHPSMSLDAFDSPAAAASLPPKQGLHKEKGGSDSFSSMAASVDFNRKENNTDDNSLDLAKQIPLPASVSPSHRPSVMQDRQVQELQEQIDRLLADKEGLKEKISAISKENFMLHDRISTLDQEIKNQSMSAGHGLRKESVKGEIPVCVLESFLNLFI